MPGRDIHAGKSIMVETQTARQISRVSILFASAFAVMGIGLLYLYIVISSVPETVKVLWASGLSIVVAFLFAIVWTMARDSEKQADREARRRQAP